MLSSDLTLYLFCFSDWTTSEMDRQIPTEHVVYTNCCSCFVLTFRTILVYNMFSRCCELLKKIYLYNNKKKCSLKLLPHIVSFALKLSGPFVWQHFWQVRPSFLTFDLCIFWVHHLNEQSFCQLILPDYQPTKKIYM